MIDEHGIDEHGNHWDLIDNRSYRSLPSISTRRIGADTSIIAKRGRRSAMTRRYVTKGDGSAFGITAEMREQPGVYIQTGDASNGAMHIPIGIGDHKRCLHDDQAWPCASVESLSRP